MAYEGSQARGPIGTVAIDLCHSHSKSCVYNLHHSSWQHQILNPLSRARDGTQILTDTMSVLKPLSHHRNAQVFLNFLEDEHTLILNPEINVMDASRILNPLSRNRN